MGNFVETLGGNMLKGYANNQGLQKSKDDEDKIGVLRTQAASLKPKDLKALAEKKLTEILEKIQAISYNIDKAKRLTKQAENSESDWSNKLSFGRFGESKTDKRSRLNTKAITMQNEAMVEMNNLIQESIKLTTISYGFAQAMTQTIAEMLTSGFKDSNGDIQRLEGVAREQVLIILDEAKKFVQHQQEYEVRQEKQETQISILERDFDKHKKDYEYRQMNQESQIDSLESGFAEHKEEYEERQKQQETQIAAHGTKIQDIHARLESKDSLDEEQTREIQLLRGELQTKREKIANLEQQLQAKQQIDDNQEAKINELRNRVQVLEKKRDGVNINLIMSFTALLVGAGSVVLQFL